MEIEVAQGQDIIRLLSDDFMSCLVIEKALATRWYDCQGSIGQYYALSKVSSKKRQKLTSELNELLSHGTTEEILNVIPTFLNLFSNGKYRMSFYDLSIKSATFQYEDQHSYSDWVPKNMRFTGAIYPNFDLNYYFYTIPKQSIDRSRVDYYCKLINAGSRPRAIIHDAYDPVAASMGEEGYTATYVLDGHHKIEAYIKLKLDIPVVSITKIEVERNHTHEILEAIYPILKDFEFQHVLKNNENIEKGNSDVRR